MKGFKNPITGLPAARSSALSNAMVLAKMGDEHDVPATVPSLPPLNITTFSPCADTSGNARPDYT